MLTLLSPAALWTLLALTLPLALHLWRRPPRTVRWSSLRFLERRTHRQPRDLRWHERLLLAVRLLLLAFLALMLTRPHWRPTSLDRPQHWALIDPSSSLVGEPSDRLKALQKAGYETRALSADFPKYAQAAVTPSGDPTPAPDLWSLLREADAGLPTGSSLAVFTPGRLASLRGNRPALSRCRVEWVITADRQSAGSPPVSPSLPPRGTSGPPLIVYILHDATRIEDARYLAAAVHAVAQVSGHEIRLTEVTVQSGDPAAVRGDFAFWLAAQTPPASLAGHVTNLVTEAEGDSAPPMETVPSWIVPQPGSSGAEALTEPVRLWRRLPAPADPDAAVLWTDSFGHPLLTRSSSGDGHTRWHFFSRFQPDWTDLPRTTALAAWLRTLFLPETSAPVFADPVHDLRRADPAQLVTNVEPSQATAVSLPWRRETPGLQGWCWLLAAILFCLERLLSHRRSPATPAVAATSKRTIEPELAR